MFYACHELGSLDYDRDTSKEATQNLSDFVTTVTMDCHDRDRD